MSDTLLPQPVVLITGATGLLGQVLARAFAADGFGLVLHTQRRREQAETLAAELAARTDGVRPTVLSADLSDPSEADRLVGKAIKAAGRLDVAVNNASVYPEDTLDTLSDETLGLATSLHVYAPLAILRALASHVSARSAGPDGDPADACVVNILDARVGDRDPAHAAYLLSKGMLADLTRQAARLYAPRLRVNGVAPGALERRPPDGPDASPSLPGRGAAGAAPLGRKATPEAVADAAVWLARARFVTGEVIAVDGGRHLRRG